MATATVRPVPRRRNADQWGTLLSRFQQAGLSPEDFCRREQLALSSFHRWRRRLSPPTPTPGFVELLPPTACTDDGSVWTVELDLPGGGSLRIRCR
jgi:hypothetical protein